MSSTLAGRTVVLAVTGSIAAYKSVLLARLLVQAGARVLPVLTQSASKFVGAVTFAGITGQVVRTDMWDPTFPGELHVALASQADAILVVPATADTLARFASGRADDLVSALVLCAKGPVLAAPAMHPRMWAHPATQANVAELGRQGRVQLVGPTHGEVASGEEGLGRMVEPLDLLKATEALLTKHDLDGVRLVVTAGPTQEPLDPVRYLGNRSSGTMGFRIAERGAARGARVTLIAGPVSLPTPVGVTRLDVTDARSMNTALTSVLENADALVMAAAVADYRPKTVSTGKIKRKEGEELALQLVANPDLLAEIGSRRLALAPSDPGARKRPVLVGFALETAEGAELIELARKKFAKKNVDLVVANSAKVALGGEDNHVILVTPTTARDLGTLSKSEVAGEILDFLRDRLTP